MSSRSPLKGLPRNEYSIQKDRTFDFDTFRGSPNFRQSNFKPSEKKDTPDVYASPLFPRKSIVASLKGSFFGLVQQDTRKSSPSKLSPDKVDHRILIEEERKSERYSVRSGTLDLEAQERIDTEQPFFDDNGKSFTLHKPPS